MKTKLLKKLRSDVKYVVNINISVNRSNNAIMYTVYYLDNFCKPTNKYFYDIDDAISFYRTVFQEEMIYRLKNTKEYQNKYIHLEKLKNGTY